MAYPPYIREKARAMRIERELTIDEIAERLALSRTTVYYWVRDLPIPNTNRQSEAQRRGTAAMQAKYARLREEAYARGAAEFAVLSLEPTFRDFVCLYVAEGYKRSRQHVSIGNSDPAVVAVADRWIRRLSSRSPYYQLQHHADQDIDELRRYWGRRLGFDGSIIRFQRKSNSNQLAGRTWRSRHGVLTVRVGDTSLRARLEAWMDLTRASWE